MTYLPLYSVQWPMGYEPGYRSLQTFGEPSGLETAQTSAFCPNIITYICLPWGEKCEESWLWKHQSYFKGHVKVRNSCLWYDFKLCSQSRGNRHGNEWAFLISRLNRWVFNLFLPNSEQFRVNHKKSRIPWHLLSSPKSPSTELFKDWYLLPG